VPTINQSILDQGLVLTYVKPEGSISDFRTLPWQTGITPNYIEYNSLLALGKIIFTRLSVDNNIAQSGSSNISVQFRYIIIPGGVRTGRISTGPASGYTVEQLKSISYEQIIALLEIPNNGGSTK
jgi:hypothetical protein